MPIQGVGNPLWCDRNCGCGPQFKTMIITIDIVISQKIDFLPKLYTVLQQYILWVKFLIVNFANDLYFKWTVLTCATTVGSFSVPIHGQLFGVQTLILW